ncbi:DUF475 domain-containing protein [Jatrophihabitans sp. YIM 134969]
MFLKTFRWSFVVTLVGLGLAFWYDSATGLALAAILAVLEISLSFDNAVVNATVLVKMNDFWQKIFLTIGVIIAVFGMRLVFPLLIVGVTAKLNPVEAVRLALEKGDPEEPGTYGFLLNDAHPAIAAFGGAFLLMLFLNFVFEERDVQWLTWLERPLAKLGRLDALSVVVALVVVAVAGEVLAPDDKVSTVLLSGILGVASYLLVDGLGSLFDVDEEGEDGEPAEPTRAQATGQVALRAGKAAFFTFLYLEVLDASFSFDGVIGAFAITSDPIIIAIGLGIGAMFIRSLTVFLVHHGTLSKFPHLEHGALWAIGALAAILIISIEYEIPEVVTGLVGVAFIGLSLLTSIRYNRTHPDEDGTGDVEVPGGAGAAPVAAGGGQN